MCAALFASDAGAETKVKAVEHLRERRAEMAQAFAAQAAQCAARKDTSNPSFHGCVDWHSAVHAAWALTAYGRATGDRKYAAFLDAELSPKRLAKELAHLRAAPAFEMPYGRAWLLRLAVERRRAGDARLDAIAHFTAGSLQEFYRRHPADPAAISYDNPSWALLNLLAYARSTKDAPLEAFVVTQARERFLRARCTLDQEEVGFIGVCTTWAWFVSEALPKDEFRRWYAVWNPGLEKLSPVASFPTPHDYGRNFSRAWGLYHLAVKLDDPRLFAAYAAHVSAGYEPPSRWRGEYYVNGHWVAQFGMLAIQPLFEAR